MAARKLQDTKLEENEEIEVQEDEPNLKISDIVKSPNVAEMLSDEQLATIGNKVYDDWQVDQQSRAEWEDRTADAMRLALQVMEEKTFPWENASSVKFPLITIAALQYQARAYPALIPDVNIVKVRVLGSDENGAKQARADRVSSYMSFQVLEEDECWEENMDKALISQAIVGCAFKKSYFDTALGCNVSEHVLAKDLYIPYFAKSLEKASRITQMLYLSSNDLLQKQRSGLYCGTKIVIQPEVPASTPLTAAVEEAQGITAPSNDTSVPYEVLEQHRYLDLDDDEYEEPYIVTIRKDTKEVLRIVARFSSISIKKNSKKEITYIAPDHFFTKFAFIPSPDGGIYDLGFGVLLGPLNESINTILNQLVDAGTLSNTAGGFLGRGVKFRSGDNSFKPFEWKRVDSTGDDIRKGILPLDVREPSQTLFKLLGLLVDYGERIGMATDPQVGVSTGQNTPAETSRNMLQEGQRVFSAVYKRTYRSLKEEFRKLYKLNSVYLNDTTRYFSPSDSGQSIILREDFYTDGKDIVPAADPNMVSDEQKLTQALTLKGFAEASPGLYNKYLVEKAALKALKVPQSEIDIILPDPKGPNALPAPQPDPDIVVETMKLEFSKLKHQSDIQVKMFDLMQEVEYLRAEILEKESRAALNYAQAEGVEKGHQVAAIQSAVSLLKQKQDGLVQVLNVLKDLSGMGKEKRSIINDITGGGMEKLETG